ncbi:MAG: Protein fmp52, mitochondrial [Bogoriella megaspora]|nr:MAG: Protein fmp52, mitochondrial [Bogoriella megaspora]
MTSAAIVGSTGFVGSNILQILLTRPSISTIHAYTRKELPQSSDKLTPITSSDSSTWPSLYPASTNIFFSSLGTTRGAAGGFQNQYKIDHDLNIDLAKAAVEKGCKHYVLISAGGASKSSMAGYMRMKGEIEDAVAELPFESVVILRPGLIAGDRGENRFAEACMRKVAAAAGGISNKLKDFWAQDAHVIARAAVKAGEMSVEGKKPEGTGKVWFVGQSDIVRLGRTEWKDE